MAVDDLWYLAKRGPDGKRLPAKRHGQGKRWRVRYTDANGNSATRFFDRKSDAETFDAKAHTGTVEAVTVDQSARNVKFGEYAERWRLSRSISQALEYQRHTDSRLRHHLYPHFGKQPIRSVTVTDVLEWIAALMRHNVAQSSIQTYFNLFNVIMNAAVADRIITDNPCKAVRISAILRGVSRAPKWVPTTEDVQALDRVVPDRYRAAIWLGAGAGTRLGEALGFEHSTRCLETRHRELHILQQLRFHKAQYGGFYLAPPKSGSVGTLDLDDELAAVLAHHIRTYPPVTVELADITSGTPDPGKKVKRRPVTLLITDEQGRPIHDQRWSDMWKQWRKAARWPEDGTFHSLRHYFATMLIVAGTDPTDVQRALRHSSLRITLETYVHWWPRKQRRRNIIGSALRPASEPALSHSQDQT